MIAFLCRRICEAIMKCCIYLCGANNDCVKKCRAKGEKQHRINTLTQKSIRINAW